MFWLTIILFLYIVCLKEGIGLKLKLLMVISFLLLLGALGVYVGFMKFYECYYVYVWYIDPPIVITVNFACYGAMYLMVLLMTILILATVCKRSFARRGEDKEPLMVDNKWKTLLKELLPFVVYPIISIILYSCYVGANFSSLGVHTSLFQSFFVAFSGQITGIAVFIHVYILNRRKRNTKKKITNEAAHKYDEDVFTRETVGATNAQTAYTFTRTSSISASQIQDDI